MRYKIIDDFLSAEECKQLIEMSTTYLAKSSTWDVEKGQAAYSDYRQSEQMFFQQGANPLVKMIEDRIAKATKLPAENGEGLQIVHYNVGGYYKEHWDYFDPAYVGNQAVYHRGGQRIATVIMYLSTSEPDAGGETWFPRVGLNVLPKQGMALIWFNVDLSSGTSVIDQSTYHEAKPVLKGEKWIATKWIRERRFR